MPRRLPRPLARRDILYGPDTPATTLVELAEAYLEEGLVFDAADFFARARDRDGLSHIRKKAVEAGDAFLLRRVQESDASLVSKADWDELARQARSLGKEAYAERAEAGGAPPAPPLQEEAALDAAPGEGSEEGEGGDAPGGKPGPAARGNGKSSAPARRAGGGKRAGGKPAARPGQKRRRERQGG